MASNHYQILRIKIIAMTLFFSLIPLFALGVTIYYQFDSAYTSKITEALKTLCQNRRNSIELFFDERVAQLITVANTQSLDRLKDEEYLKKVFDTMQSRSKSFLDLGVIDDEGNHVAYVGPYHEKLKSVNYHNETWFQAAMSYGVHISDVFLGFRKIPHFIIAVTGADKNRRWILRATINSEIIDNIIHQSQVGKRGDAFIINRANVLQTTPRFSGKLFEHPTTPDFSSAMGTNVEEISANGDHTLFATCPITNPKWVLVLREDPQEEMAPLFKAQYAGVMILIAGIFLVVVGTVFTTRSMTNALVRMEHEKAASDDLMVQSAKMATLGKMAAGIAHEINNPLAIIGEKAGWMKDLLEKEDIKAGPNLAEFEDCIKKIERQVDRSRTITHRLLRFGRRMEPTEEMVDVNQVLAGNHHLPRK